VRRLRGESLDKIADEIVMVSNAVTKMRKTRLSEDTLMLLIQDAVGSDGKAGGSFRSRPSKPCSMAWKR
jgi:hypothetical protein